MHSSFHLWIFSNPTPSRYWARWKCYSSNLILGASNALSVLSTVKTYLLSLYLLSQMIQMKIFMIMSVSKIFTSYFLLSFW